MCVDGAEKRDRAGVTAFARQRCRHMGLWFAERYHVVMAGRAVSRDSGVVKLDGEREIYGVLVTICAGRRSRDVVSALAGGDGAVVASRAVYGRLRVVNYRDLLK